MMSTDSAPTDPPDPRRSRWLRLLPLAILVLLIAIGYQQGWHELLGLEQLLRGRAEWSAFIESSYALGLLLYFLAVVVFVALTIPGATPLTVFGGLLFGKYVGTATTLAGVIGGAAIMFGVVRTSLGSMLARRIGPRLERFRDGFQRHALNYVITLRLLPFCPFWMVTVAAALLGVRLRHFLVGTALGIAPLIVILTTMGDGLDEVLAQQQQELDACLAAGGTAASGCNVELTLSTVLTPELLIALAILALLSLAPVVVRRWRQRRA